MTRTPKRVSNRLFNDEVLPGGGSRTPTRQVEEVRARTLEAAYICLLRGMVRLMNGGSDRSPGEASRAVRSFYVAGVRRL